MRLRVVAVGRPRLDYARLGVEEYAGRIRKYAPLELLYVREAQELLPKAEGHLEAVRKGADLLLSLSPLTLQHELALLVLLEQLYRLLTLRAGHPYHRP